MALNKVGGKMKIRTVLMRRVVELSKKYQLSECVQNPETKYWDIRFVSNVTVRLNEDEFERFKKEVPVGVKP